MVCPEHKLVVAFTAGIPDDGYDPEFDLFRDYILPAIIGNSNDMILLTIGLLAASGIGIVALVAILGYRRNRVT